LAPWLASGRGRAGEVIWRQLPGTERPGWPAIVRWGARCCRAGRGALLRCGQAGCERSAPGL